MKTKHIIVVGGGQAGSTCCTKLSQLGFDGEITLVGAEDVLPYQRPPLSKGYLLGDIGREDLYLRSKTFYDDRSITLKLGHAVTSISPTTKTVSVGKESLSYDELVIATGSQPRLLPASLGGDLEGVYVVRALADVDAMAPEFVKGRHALIVGGGYIGLEAAAVARKLGVSVTMLEMSDRILQRVAAAETSAYFRDLHKSRGVDLREGIGLKRLLGDARVKAAELTDGTTFEVDFVIAGVGILPDTTIAADAGLAIENGIKTDGQGRTSQPHIWSAGDCASFPLMGRQQRLESVQHAIDHAELVAENILGAKKEYDPQPWFWSDQYDVKLQIAGLNTGFDQVVTRTGEKQGAVSHWYFKNDKLLAVDAVNDPRAYMVGKRLIESGKSPTAEQISSPQISLMQLM